MAKKHKIVIIAPLFEKAKNGKFYNSAVVIGSNGEILGTYRKAHIPQDPYFYEKDYFAAGDTDYGFLKQHLPALVCSYVMTNGSLNPPESTR